MRVWNRRYILLAAAGAVAGPLSRGARAEAVQSASVFVQRTGDRLVAIVNGSQSVRDKRDDLAHILDVAVDVAGIAQFCLGRFWRGTSPSQQAEYVHAFRQVLVTSISARLGQYKGVKLTVQHGKAVDDSVAVTSIVERPNNPPATVDWVVAQPATAPRIIDVIAEGTSLRLTQRQDYASFLSQNRDNVDALIEAMRAQVSRETG